ncbi:MAG: pantetheine-phosphate adenylyltransferase [Oscillospiraceae bacterium]|jgi:pantetheine-phosphate adenylyltransferase|nr:pantetheine-phosphate adenylyltransferase [Oscillospiraceae bacterium]MCR5648436.1 pantetheine-phosphate adenylyltransferase [Oscillospiraceae bacterium]
MKTAIYPGSFDPITLGHLNLIKRASRVFDKLIVCVMVNHEKSPLFSVEERMEQIRRVTAKFENVEVDSSDDLVANFARTKGASAIIRGLRALSDFEKECQMAVFNKKINPDIDTFFLAASEKYMYLSSSAVRELALFKADLTDYAPRELIDEINQRISEKNSVRR